MKLLVATTNPGKLREYQELLSDLPVEWVSLREVGLGDMDVEETEDTFAGNAMLKARTYSEVSGLVTMADDSGLVVDALNGAPGVYSARYGKPELVTDADRYGRVLAQLADVPDSERSARFICVIAIAAPGQDIQTVEGVFEGRIGYEPRGTNGFGYDPIFITADGRTLAELPSDEKNRVSHRGLALVKARPIIENILKG